MNNKKFRIWTDGDWVNPENYTLKDIAKPETFIVHQFVGILDKNMKEIYEGDVVMTDDGLGEVFYFQDHCAYGIKTNISFSLFLTLSLKNIEVVGNMVENYIYDESGTLMTREDYEKNTHT